jgi:hypothetical protein
MTSGDIGFINEPKNPRRPRMAFSISKAIEQIKGLGKAAMWVWRL